MAKSRSARDHVAKARTLQRTGNGLPYGLARLNLLEEAVRLADTHSDVPLAFELRQDLIDAAIFGGFPEVAIVAFSWCLGQADRDPEQYETFSLLWKYKWVASRLPQFPQISRQQIEEMLADMAVRYERNGGGSHPVLSTTLGIALQMDDLPWAKATQKKFLAARRTALSNCPACEVDAQVKFYLDTGRRKIGLRKAEPIIAHGMRCSSIPRATYARLLRPLVEEKNYAQAAAYHLRGYPYIETNPSHLNDAAEHLIFLTLTDNRRKALTLLARHLPNALASTCPDTRFDVFRAAGFLMDHLAHVGKPIRLRVPPTFPDTVDRTNPAAIRDWFLGESRTLAADFDARNGQEGYTRRLDLLPRMRTRITPYPLDGVK